MRISMVGQESSVNRDELRVEVRFYVAVVGDDEETLGGAKKESSKCQ